MATLGTRPGHEEVRKTPESPQLGSKGIGCTPSTPVLMAMPPALGSPLPSSAGAPSMPLPRVATPPGGGGPLSMSCASVPAPTTPPPPMMPFGPVADGPPIGGPDFLDDAHKLEPWLAPEAQQARWVGLGLDEPRAAAFAGSNEFISLGCFCGVSRTLQALGLKRYSYPFDWVRCPVEGVIHCLENRFEDFLTFTASCQPPYVKQKVFTTSRWGGSFWHHDPLAPGTADTFLRRAERFLGLRELPMGQGRVFVVAVNSTREISSVPRLFDALKNALPHARVRLLVLIDLQKTQGPVCLSGSSSNSVLFYQMSEEIFGAPRGAATPQRGQSPLPKPNGSGWSMQAHAEAYAEAVAYAIKYWSGIESTLEQLRVVPNIASLSLLCGQWDGGSPTNELFFPRPLVGPRLHIKASYGSPVATHSSSQVASPPAPMAIPLLQTRASSVGARSDSARRSPSPSRSDYSASPVAVVPERKWICKLDQSISSVGDPLSSSRRGGLWQEVPQQGTDLANAEHRLAASEQRVAQLKQDIARVRSIFMHDPWAA